MADRYGEVNKVGKAYTAMVSLKQGDGEKFGDFFVKFQKFSAYLHYDDETEKHTLMSKLNARYANRLMDGQEPENTKALVDRLYRLEDQLERMNTLHPRSENKISGRAGSSASTTTTTSSYSRIVPTTFRQTTASTTPRAQLPEKYRNLKPLTEAER